MLVIGAGIHGACAAWDAALRGLSVALVDQGDFGGGASANSLKVIHGGLRYLQQGDLRRMRESIRERAAFLRIAPELVRPAPFVIATRGAGKHGRAALGVALWLNDRISFDRNRGLPAGQSLPGGRLLGRDELARLAPALPVAGASGGALWYDGQALDTERLTLAIVSAAAGREAVVANHVRITSLLGEGGRVTGARAVDEQTGNAFEIAAQTTILAAGCAGRRLADAARSSPGGPDASAGEHVALAMNVVACRRLEGVAFGVRSAGARQPDPAGAGARFLFFVPWRESTMIGTFYRRIRAADAGRPPGPEDLQELVEEVRAACPALELSAADVRLVHHGVLPLKRGHEAGDPDALAQHHRILDHERTSGTSGLITVVGVKYTTGRLAAEQAVDLACEKLRRGAPCVTAQTPLPLAKREDASDPPVASGASVRRGEVLHAVREEMAWTLADVVMRRTGMGTQGCPPAAHLEAVSRLMAEELGWDEARRASELADLGRAYAPVAVATGADAGPARIGAARG